MNPVHSISEFLKVGVHWYRPNLRAVQLVNYISIENCRTLGRGVIMLVVSVGRVGLRYITYHYL
jgi:hypothetical protein